ncbi:RNA polymerase sigma factor [Fodinicola acaciae]|uniref:RNA polymerase sigma factor n=1 Tax=Fodinicola acaciae TaxID=2681555 RepID=UPI0013D16D8F|nr:sigma-70 family RNA polymerase sigma factor [Fodinicola acaciae]
MTDQRHRFEAVYRRHYRAVLAYALARAEPEVAADAVAETFVVAWRRFGELPAEPIGWLLAVTRRTIANQRRSADRQRALYERLANRPADGTRDPAELVAERRAVYAALDRLSPDDREILMLVGWDGLGRREAARVFGCSPVAFAVRLHRARKRFAAALAAQDAHASRKVAILEETT